MIVVNSKLFSTFKSTYRLFVETQKNRMVEKLQIERENHIEQPPFIRAAPKELMR